MSEFADFGAKLIVLTGLIGFLLVRIEQRRRVEYAKWLAHQKEIAEWLAQEGRTGATFDVSAITPQIKRIRQDHVAARQCRPHDAAYRRGLLATAREAVTSLAFFHRAEREDPTRMGFEQK